MATFIKGEPPSKNEGLRPEALVQFATDLRQKPGVWAVHPRYLEAYAKGQKLTNKSSTTVANINHGRIASLREGFQARARHGIVFVRYVGGEK